VDDIVGGGVVVSVTFSPCWATYSRLRVGSAPALGLPSLPSEDLLVLGGVSEEAARLGEVHILNDADLFKDVFSGDVEGVRETGSPSLRCRVAAWRHPSQRESGHIDGAGPIPPKL
jgi:hypothetical protein